MPKYKIIIESPRPYFAEIPYALWGEVNYDSEGDCKWPTDRSWTEIYLTNRESRQSVHISSIENAFEVESIDTQLAARAATYLLERCSGKNIGINPKAKIGNWSYVKAEKKTIRIRSEFPRPELKPFDLKLFWGSWKWVGWYATEFTWVGRWIMNSILVKDTRAVFLCIQWLKQPPVHPEQSAALRYALNLLTSKNYRTNKDWIKWYEGGLFRAGAKQNYPEPDFDKWLIEMKGG